MIKNIHINTAKFTNLADKLQKEGYNIIKPTEPHTHALIDYEKFITEKVYTPAQLLDPKKEFIILADDLKKINKSILLNSGIARVLLCGEEGILNFLSQNRKKKPLHDSDTGTFLIFDLNEPNKKILNSILHTFGYKSIYCNDIKTFFTTLSEIEKNNIVFSFLNLSTPDLDLNEFIRQAYLNKDIKKIPLLAYRNQDENICIEQISSGINRITSYILKFDELLSFMFEFISRKKISQCVSKTCEISQFSELHKYAKHTLPENYFKFKDSLFEPMNAFSNESLNNLNECTEQIKYFLSNMESFSWLRNRN